MSIKVRVCHAFSFFTQIPYSKKSPWRQQDQGENYEARFHENKNLKDSNRLPEAGEDLQTEIQEPVGGGTYLLQGRSSLGGTPGKQGRPHLR